MDYDTLMLFLELESHEITMRCCCMEKSDVKILVLLPFSVLLNIYGLYNKWLNSKNNSNFELDYHLIITLPVIHDVLFYLSFKS